MPHFFPPKRISPVQFYPVQFPPVRCFRLTAPRIFALVGLAACTGLLTVPACLSANIPKAPAHAAAVVRPAKPVICLNPDQIARIMEFLQRTQPDVYQKATALRHSHPRKFVKLISEAAPNFRWLEHLQKHDPKLFNLTLQDIADTHKSFQIAGELRQPGLPRAESEKLRARLVRVVTDQFDVRQKIRTHELNRLLRRINTLRVDLKDRQQKRMGIIARRVRSLIGRPPSLNW